MKISNQAYDILKYIAQYVLPGLGTLYFALATIWGLPYGEQVVGTITAVDTFLGILLGISTSRYDGDGVLRIDSSNAEKDIYRLEMNTPLEEMQNKTSVNLKVDPNAKLT